MALKQVWAYFCVMCSKAGPLMEQRPPWDPAELTRGLHPASPLKPYTAWRLSRNKNHLCGSCASYYDGIK